MTGVVSKVTATVSNLNHTFPSDIRILLVNPAGQDTILMSGAGGSSSVTNVTLTFDDAAAFSLPGSSQLNFVAVPNQIVSGTFKPTNFGPGVNFPSPAPAGPYVASLAALNGATPNGSWALYVLDDSPGDSGNIAGGWSLDIATLSPLNGVLNGQAVRLAPTAIQSNGSFTLTLSGQPGKTYVIQASSDLASWVPVATNVTSVAGNFQFTDTNVVSFPYRFYRARSFP
jgi:subtilisin-like proprotein convertase family protein